MLDNFLEVQQMGKSWKDDVLNKNQSCDEQEKKGTIRTRAVSWDQKKISRTWSRRAGKTKTVKRGELRSSQHQHRKEYNVINELDDWSERFPVGMPMYKEFDKVEHKGKIIGYDSWHMLYEVEYEDRDKEEFYHHEVHAHKDWVELGPTKQKKSAKSKQTNFGKARKKKSKSNSPKPRYWTRSWKCLQTLATNALLAQFAPTPNDYEQHFHTLSIDNIQAISALKKTKQYEGLDMTEEGISTEMIKNNVSTH